MLPPLTMTDAEADELVSRVVDLIKKLVKNSSTNTFGTF